MLIFAEDCFISAEDSSKLDILHSICLSLQKIAASQQYESKHSFAPAETYDENLLKTIQNK